MHARLMALGPMLTAAFSLVTLLPLSLSAQDAKVQDALHKADGYLVSLTAQGSFRGSVLVGINGKVVLDKGYGFADEEWNAPNSPETKFRIFSLTKQFSGACILLLQERNLLNVQDPVSKYIGDLPVAWRPITVHQLLTHTSGIPNYPEVSQRAKELERIGATPREMLALVAAKPLEFKPGTQLHYSNTGYILLGMIIEQVSGQSYAQFLKKNIFEPLGMQSSGYDDQSIILKNRASGYSLQNGHVINAPLGDMSFPFAAGAIYSTVEDMYRWNEALTEPGRLLTSHSLQQMFAVYPETTAYGEQNYGYGVVITHRFGKLLYYHGGGWYGFSSIMQRYPTERVCIIVLSNLEKGTDAADHIAYDLFGQSLPPAK
jgi:CubicO group peptidase (beta-lactamase class C family)